MKKVSIILAHYNHDALTIETLQSVEKLNTKGIELSVVVVDNGSTQPFQYESKLVTVVRSEENTGFAGGNNIGFEYAFEHFSPDYFMLLNTDTRVHPDLVVELVKFAESHDNVGAVAPKIYFEKGFEFHKKSYKKDELGNVIWFAGGSIDWKNMYAFHRGVDEVDRGQTDLPVIKRNKDQMPYYGYQTMDFVSGCCALFPAEVIKKTGGFDASYFMYWEDVDLSMRIKQMGLELYYCPSAVLWHKNAGSTGGSGSDFHKKYQEGNRFKFAMKYAPLKTKLSLLKQKFM